MNPSSRLWGIVLITLAGCTGAWAAPLAPPADAGRPVPASGDRLKSQEDSAAADRIFASLIECNNYFVPFVDKYSRFGVVFDSGMPLGLGMAQIRSAEATFQVTCSTLRLWLEEDGKPVSINRNSVRYLPWCVEEGAELPYERGPVEVRARHFYYDSGRLVSVFRLHNGTRGTVTLHPRFLGQISGDRWRGKTAIAMPEYGYFDLQLRETWASASGNILTGGIRDTGKPLRLPGSRICIAPLGDGPVQLRLSTQAFWIDKASQANSPVSGLRGKSVFYDFVAGGPSGLVLAAGATAWFSFLTECQVASCRDPDPPFAGVPAELRTASSLDRAVGQLIAEARKDFLRRVAFDRPPAVPPALESRLWRARLALLRTGYQGDGRGEFGDRIASTCVASCAGFTRVFFWDSLFTSAALATFEPAFARGAITSVFSRQTEEGYCPEHGFDRHVPARHVIGAPQAPVATWAVEKYLQANPQDRTFLQEAWPYLVRNRRYWQEFGDKDGDGLAEWTWKGQTADNSPLYDEQGEGIGWMPPVASVQLAAFLYRDAVSLSRFAELLGKKDDAARYRARAEKLFRDFTQVCYVPEDKTYWDYNHATRRHAKVKTFYMFWPIWAGMPVPAEVKRHLIEDVLLDPKQFFGAIPFPSVAYDEARYDPMGYWRGKTWPNVYYWLLEMLVREGYAPQAEEAANRFLAAWFRGKGYSENMGTDPGIYDGGGSTDYNWGIAAVHLIGTGAYRKPLP